MAKLDQAGRTPVIPPRRKSLHFEQARSKRDTFKFPVSHHLIVTTTKYVFSWSSRGLTNVFHSGSEGIVAASKATDGSGLLAVADSSVVILHDIKKGMQKSYKLHGSHGEVRLLRYGGDSQNLFFTTALQNAVQVYSLRHAKLINPSLSHPSPPSVFALSASSHLLLSASITPPTIYVTDLLHRSPPVLLQPQCSSSAVVAADFHSVRANVFTLAFADGSCALYNAKYMFRHKENDDRPSPPAGSCPGTGGEISYIRRLHAMTNTVSASACSPSSHGQNHGPRTPVMGDKALGISAVAFVPGSKAKAVTVGSDGTCHVIDFAVIGETGARILRSWHIQGPATSVALTRLPASAVSGRIEQETRSNGFSHVKKCVLIAIGRQDGKVLLYDLGGRLLQDRTFGLGGPRIIDVEWMSGETWSELNRVRTGRAMPRKPIIQKRRNSLGAVLARSRPPSGEWLIGDGANEPGDVPFRSSLAGEASEEPTARPDHIISTMNHLNCSSPMKSVLEPKTSNNQQNVDLGSEDSETTIKGNTKGLSPPREQTALTEVDASRSTLLPSTKASAKNPLPAFPPFPVRPAPGTSSENNTHHADTARICTTISKNSVAPEIEQSAAEGNNAASKESARNESAMKPKLITISKPPPNYRAGATKAVVNDKETVIQTRLRPDFRTDNAPKPQRPIRRVHQNHFAKGSNRRSRTKFQAFRPPLHAFSEATNDTVIDWSAGSSHPVALKPPRPSPLPLPPATILKQSRESLAGSSPSDGSMFQWPSFRRPRPLDIPTDVPHPSDPFNHPPSRHQEHLRPLTGASSSPRLLPLPSPTSPTPPTDRSVALQTDVRPLVEELNRQFSAQRAWISGKLKEQNVDRERLEGENRWLKAEVVRLKGEVGK